MENGDFVIPLSDKVFLVIAEGQVNLMDSQGGKPLMPVFAEPKLFEGIRKEVLAQSADIDSEVANRKDWLSWVGWTSSMFGTVQADTQEFMNLQDLQTRLSGAMKRLGYSSESQSIPLEADAVELFVGCHVLSDNRVVIYTPGGHPAYIDGHTMVTPAGQKQPLNPQVKAAIVSVLKKMSSESEKDIASDIAENKSLLVDQTATKKDLAEYQSIQAQNAYDPSYEVDYGTDSIPVTQAISMTQRDLDSITLDQQLLEVNARKSRAESERFQAVLRDWGQ